MDFDLTDEQKLLQDTASRWAADAYPTLEQVQAGRALPRGLDRARWGELADLGLLALPFNEADGGIGGGAVETMLVMEALGAALAPVPYLPFIVEGAAALRLAASDAQKARCIPAVAAGEMRIALAHHEHQARWDIHDVATTAIRVGDGYRIDGSKALVAAGEAATHLVVSARTSGDRRDAAGITLFLVATDTPGIRLSARAAQDGSRLADISFADVVVSDADIIGPVDGALPVLAHITDITIAALCAEAVGAMEALHRLTLEYLRTRKQFGVSIGTFQTLQHKAVDMLIALEQARSMTLYAAMMAESQDATERGLALSAAKVQVNRSARIVGQSAVQLHGGIGMTMEYIGAHHFRRLAAIEQTLGDTAHHLRRVAEAGGLVPAGDMSCETDA